MENEIVEKPDYVEELVNLIRSGESDEGISEKIDNYHDNDIASALDELNEKERKKLYQILGVEIMSEIFAYVDDVGKYLEEIELEDQPLQEELFGRIENAYRNLCRLK